MKFLQYKHFDFHLSENLLQYNHGKKILTKSMPHPFLLYSPMVSPNGDNQDKA